MPLTKTQKEQVTAKLNTDSQLAADLRQVCEAYLDGTLSPVNVMSRVASLRVFYAKRTFHPERETKGVL